MSLFDLPRRDAGANERTVDAMFSRLLQGESLSAFCDWFAGPDGPMPGARAPDADPRAARAVARTLWAAVPMPHERWRPRGLPKLERNDPCYCGSGRKYKHCCATWASVPLPFDAPTLLALAIQHAPPDALAPASVRALPPQALAQAAMFWMDEGRPEQVARVLLPLFDPPDGLDARHEPAFEVLMGAMQQLGWQERRFALVRQIGRSRDKTLATAARCREVSMLADEGNFAQAWALFKQVQRDAPDDPQLLHLELITLLHEGRADEARLRGPLLAAKARRGGFDELAQVLLQLAEHGLRAVYDELEHAGSADADEITAAWLALCAQAPAELDADAARALYHIDTQGPPRRGARRLKAAEAEAGVDALVASMSWLRVRPARTLSAIERRWQRRFPVGKPDATLLVGDAGVLIEDAVWATEFLRISPQGWLSVQVMDDLLLAAQERLTEDDGPAERQSAWRLAEHALRLLRALWHQAPDAAAARQARLGAEWTHPATQPLLRLLAQAIDVGHATQRDVLALAEWSLALNPIDNHGWRDEVVQAYTAQGRPADALALLDQYPGDWPPAQHRRALALYTLGRHDEAAAVLAAAHAEYPAFMLALWPDVLDAPPDSGGPGIPVGGELAAFDYRTQARAAWVKSGALAWSKGLKLTAKPARKTRAKKSATKGGLLAGGTSTEDLALPAPMRQHLQGHYDWPRLHGFLTAIAWSPDMLMPGRWVPSVLDWRTRALPKTQAAQLKALNTDLDAIMRLYNSLNAPLANAQAGMAMPLPALADELAAGDDEVTRQQALHTWAAGFVQAAELGAAGWRRAGRPVQARPAGKASAFSVLYALAARAPRATGAASGDAPVWQPLQDDGQPLLQGLDVPAVTADTAEQIAMALADLWQAVLPARLARQRGGAGGALQIDSFSLD
ncbi:UPF0149 family protein [Ottowia testudinis]|uniref:UPF0149 family protein n=1 Tax=Ottowia testudinis TaxID=2816950 RepID=A0A975CE45_9BURK|nr:UPF0149 family protein [Ottowia testudinis]QTD44768.1 UPF0149 family protein [Ottowia testudinis]